MMKFIRKYQRLFFLIITIVVIVTFAFWGTSSTFHENTKKSDKVIAKSLGETKITYSDIQKMANFLSLDWSIYLLSPQKHLYLLNDGVIIHDILNTGLSDLFCETYFDFFKPHLEKNFEKIKKFTTYQHPYVDFISARSIWKEYHPVINELLQKIQSCEDVSIDMMKLLFQLYQEQLMFSPLLLKKTLLYQQSKFPWMETDARIYHDELALFGFHSLRDWFGNNFIDMATQFILNITAFAEKKGYVISYTEAKNDLLQNIQRGYNQLNLSNKESDEVNFQNQLAKFHLDEIQAVKIWQKILLFRKFFQHIGDSILLDSSTFKDYFAYTREKAEINYYELPRYLQIQDFSTLLKLQMYLHSVSPSLSNNQEFLLELSDIYFPIEKIEKDFPQLIESRYKVKLATVALADVEIKIGEKELWQWQLQEENWQKLQQHFSHLALKDKASRQLRFEKLENLPQLKRYKIDQFSRDLMVKENPQWINDCFQKQTKQEKILSFRENGKIVNLEYVANGIRLQNLLEKMAQNNKDENAEEQLLCFTDDQQNHYQIEFVAKSPSKNIISFQQALEQKIIDPLLEEYLQNKYQQLCQNEPSLFLDENQQRQPFEKVKNLVGKFAFSPLFEAIEQDCIKEGITIDKEQEFSFYANYRFYYYMRKIHQQMMMNPENTVWLKQMSSKAYQGEELVSNIQDQWKIESNTTVISRDYHDQTFAKCVFVTNSYSWSDIVFSEKKNPFFFYVKNKSVDQIPFEKELKKCKKLLKDEAVYNLSQKMIEEMQKNKAMVLPATLDE